MDERIATANGRPGCMGGRSLTPCMRNSSAPRIRPGTWALLLFLGLVLGGCATLPTDYPRPPSSAIEDHESTTIGRYVAEEAARHPGESGFAIIRQGRRSFTARIAISDMAEKSLDLQYYIWEEDKTGRLLAERLVRAADRGVRVRLLLDDINFAGRDSLIASLDAHPNIEVRMFNPVAHRRWRLFDFVADFRRVNHRMHNKVIIMDNALAIVGGRNIGDDYFDVDPEANFRDMDIAAGGPVVRDVSQVFDYFFNSDWAVPIKALVDRSYTDEDLASAMAAMRARIAADDYPHPIDQEAGELAATLESEVHNFIWAPGRIVWDDPAAFTDAGVTSRMLEGLHQRISTLERDLLIESAYFIPRDRGIEKMAELHGRGVRIRVLTNSLVSNDVLAAHAGYSGRRKQVLESGVELYELRADAGQIRKHLVYFKAKAALHAKVIVFDRQDTFIGSLNLDPRSTDLNTEAGIYVESPELAAQVVEWMDAGVSPDNSYRLSLDSDGDILWTTRVDGAEVSFDRDPDSSFWQRFAAGFIRILPVEDQL